MNQMIAKAWAAYKAQNDLTDDTLKPTFYSGALAITAVLVANKHISMKAMIAEMGEEVCTFLEGQR